MTCSFTSCATLVCFAGYGLIALTLLQNDEEKIDKEPVPLPVLVTNAVTAIIAGSDTTSSSLSHALYFLIKHPAPYERLRAEVDAMFPLGEGEPTDTAKLAQMDYLNAVM